MRQNLFVALAVAALVVTAGCTLPGGGGSTGTANLYVSSQGDAVGDFQQLRISVTKVGVYQTSNGTWQTTSVTEYVDLTNVRGENVTFVGAMELPEGEYSKVYVKVDNVKGITKDGNETSVEVRSDQLEVARGFQLDGDETTSYVVDLEVVPNVDGAYLITGNYAGSGPDQPVNGSTA